MRLRRLALFGLPLVALAAAPMHDAPYHVADRFTLGGDGFWDYLALDTVSHRLFIARQNRLMVVDPSNGKVLGEVPGLKGAHGTAFDQADGRGFATSGGDGTVRMFDLKTLRPLSTIDAAPDADAILFDPATSRIFTFNGDSKSSSVIDARTGKNIGTIDLGAVPEFGVSAGNGMVYVNLESADSVAEIDARAMKVVRRWSIAPCKSPSGLAIDVRHHLLFSGCRNELMGISDARAGKLVATEPIGAGVDADRFDAGTGDAFASNGDGTITVVHEDSPTHFTVAQTVETMRGARTMELDPRTHTLYTVSARFGERPAQATPDNPRRRPPMVPNTFTLLVVSR